LIRAVIFDIDGTLVDSVDLHAKAWQETFAHFGHEVAFAEVRSQIGKGGDQLMPVFLSEAELDRRGDEIEAFRSNLFKTRYLPQVRGFPAVRQLFERVRANGQRIALASSAKADELATYKEIAGIADLVDEETSADDAERSKPHPDIFEAALTRLDGMDPSEAIVVGDSPYDAEAAGKIGLRTIGVLSGGFPQQDLRRAGCMAIYRDPTDLLARFERSPAVPGTAAEPKVARPPSAADRTWIYRRGGPRPCPPPAPGMTIPAIAALGLPGTFGVGSRLAYCHKLERVTRWPGRWTRLRAR
jgi:HAD superfamily hydrolase (TIGR01509 family)